LEGLLFSLIKDKVLKGENWANELKELLSKKVERQQKSIPKVSLGVILSVLGILLIPITKFIAESYLKSFSDLHISVDIFELTVAGLILSSSFIFLFLWFLWSVIKAKSGERCKVARDLFYLYKGQEIERTSTETISEDEPTVLQFTKFLSKLENGVSKRLVIVFDNMDRLPAPKVKEIWSSIHTFFANDYNSLKTWAIVPFDNKHICDIFKGEADSDKLRADSYIHKTFSIVFHVSPPILSD